MSKEISLTFSLSAFKQGAMIAPVGMSLANGQFDMSGLTHTRSRIIVGTNPTQIPLAQVSQPTWCVFANEDTVSQIVIMDGTTGRPFLFLAPGWAYPCALASTVTPFAVAGPQPAGLEYLLITL